MPGRVVPFAPPSVEDLAVDERSLDLVHGVWRSLTNEQRAVFNNYLVGALVANLPLDDVTAAVRIAKSCSRLGADDD